MDNEITINEITTIKLWKVTRRLAKILAAHYGISIMDLLQRLVTEEIKRQGLSIK